MPETSKSDLRVLFETLADDVAGFFSLADQECSGMNADLWDERTGKRYFWDHLSIKSQELAVDLETRLLRYCAELANQIKRAPLAGDEDQRDLKESAKAMRSALRLRRYTLHELQVINDEDVILGVRQPEQSDDEPLHPSDAENVFFEQQSRVASLLKLSEASLGFEDTRTMIETKSTSKYRPGTAFIMMWMDEAQPALNDVVDAVKDVFQSVGVKAIRADDIEHEGLITQRILDEICTSEFLFADLTGARPNVYYEVGYAHALGKRVVLYRKAGTGLHFDLAGYNCPEYESLRDLREKLTKRLVNITNRNPVA